MRIQGLTTDFFSVLKEKQRKLDSSSESGGVSSSLESQERDAQGGGGYSQSQGNSSGNASDQDQGPHPAPGLRRANPTRTFDLGEVRQEAELFSAASYAQALGLEAIVVNGTEINRGLRVILRDKAGKQLRAMSPDEFMDLRRDSQLQAGLAGSLQRGRLLDRKA